MNLYALPPLIVSGLIFFTGLFGAVKNIKSILNIMIGLVAFTTSTWLFSYGIMYLSMDNEILANFWGRCGYSGVILLPIVYYHFVLLYLHKMSIKQKNIIIFFYLFGLTLITFIFKTNYFFLGVRKYFWGYYPIAGRFHALLLLTFYSIFLVSARILLTDYIEIRKLSKNFIRVNQEKYLLLAFSIATLNVIDFLPNYGINIYPFGYLFALVTLLILFYAIFKYRLMDIKIAITRTGIFIVVYTLILGLPFAVAISAKSWLIDILGPNWWISPLGLMAVLATGGPFIYIYISRKAEARLLREQRRYQDTLKQASVGMTRIRNLRKLLDLIAHIVTKTVRISYAAIYLYNRQTDEFVLQVSRDKGRIALPKLTSDNPLIKWITLQPEPLIYEEVKRHMEDTKEVIYKLLEENMRLLSASVVIPSFLEDRFLGLIILGDKVSGQIYTPDDLNVFQVLASQAALAIENAQFYEETKEMQEQIAQAEKMATVGTMADGLSHQINNRFYALSLIAGDTIDTIKMTDTTQCSPEVKEMINQINHALGRIQANVMQGGEVVKGIMKYTRKGEEGFEALSLDQVIDGTLEMVQFKVRLSEIDIVRNYPKDTPRIKGNIVQLEEVFFNFIDNAYEAILERKSLLNEEGYRGRVTISAYTKDSKLEIIVEDNGIGVKEEDFKKIFTPFFTTKTSSRKGTGLGLYVIRRIITDIHRGRIAFESDYKIGTRFIIELPIAR